MKNILFIHTNFPAQYVHLARTLAADPNYQVFAFGSWTAKPVEGVRLFQYSARSISLRQDSHPFSSIFSGECLRAEQIMYLANRLRAERIIPDVIFVHPGWGESLPLRVLFPEARICLYCEMFYRPRNSDVGFDPEFPAIGIDGLVAVSLRNATTLLALNDADLGVSPTNWQKSTYPAIWRERIQILHEGVDTEEVRPDPDAVLAVPNRKMVFRAGEEIVTFVARSLEPYRGIHSFVRALPTILQERPNAQIVLVGGTGVSYGRPAAPGTSWARLFFQEVAGRCDMSRVHLLGRVTRETFIRTLQVSAAHVYLTYPFVLSWSLIESMAAGCAIVASDTDPVREVIQHGETGYLTSFFSPEGIAENVVSILANPTRHQAIRMRARSAAQRFYDLKTVTLPQHLKLAIDLADRNR